MKYITVNPGFDQWLKLELGEEYKLTIDLPVDDGAKVIRTTVNITVPDVATPFAFKLPSGIYYNIEGDIPKIKETIFECIEGGCIPNGYKPAVEKLIFVKSIKFGQFHNAIQTAEQLQKEIRECGQVSISTLNYILGFKRSTDNDIKHGWSTGDDFTVTGERDGIHLHLPAAHYFGEVEKINTNKITCLHCAHVYSLDLLYHSVVNVGILNIQGIKSDKLHDAWNCPACGGQFVGRERFPTIK